MLGLLRKHEVASNNIHVGIDPKGRSVFLPVEACGSHVSIFGVSGVGKSFLLCLLASAFNALDIPVAIVDAKGGSTLLAEIKRSNLQAKRLDFVAPGIDDSKCYDPLANATPREIGLAIASTTTYESNAAIYGAIARNTFATLAKALQVLKEEVSLISLEQHCDRQAMVGLATRLREQRADEVAEELLRVAYSDSPARPKDTRLRLSELRAGVFGQDWVPDELLGTVTMEDALIFPGITYWALGSLGGQEDQAAGAALLFNDVQRVVASRISRVARGEEVSLAVLIIDDYASLASSEELTTLLTQAREAKVMLFPAMQYIPDSRNNFGLRKALLGTGVQIIFRLGEDCEDAAGIFGTKESLAISTHIGASAYGEGTATPDREYRVHPDEIRSLQRGSCFLRVANGRRGESEIFEVANVRANGK